MSQQNIVVTVFQLGIGILVLILIISYFNKSPETLQNLIDGLKQACGAEGKVKVLIEKQIIEKIKDPKAREMAIKISEYEAISQNQAFEFLKLLSDEERKKISVKEKTCMILGVVPDNTSGKHVEPLQNESNSEVNVDETTNLKTNISSEEILTKFTSVNSSNIIYGCIMRSHETGSVDVYCEQEHYCLEIYPSLQNSTYRAVALTQIEEFFRIQTLFPDRNEFGLTKSEC